MKRYIHNTLNPAIYHGHGAKPPFFEGWYYKLISADERYRYAIIPGVILGDRGHAFIQVLNGVDGSASYHSFPIDAFMAAEHDFEVEIAGNRFTNDTLELDFSSNEITIQGSLQFNQTIPWPVRWHSPGIMGWYAWVPGMECYHGVLSFDHVIQGQLTINGERIDFEGGRGYIEKDWGKSFPSAWVWFQSNHFEKPGTSLTASIAVIPFLGSSFNGFIVGLWHAGQLYRFATYTGASVVSLEIEDVFVRWTLRDKHCTLALTARKAEGGLILGPTREDMEKRVNETLQATVDVRLTSKDGEEIFSGQGRHAGLEVQGDVFRLATHP